MCRELRPDILLTDIRMPEMDGLELIRQIRNEGLDIKILILTCLEEFSYLHEAMHLGIEDYILKTALKPEKLLEVLEAVRQKYWTVEDPAGRVDREAATDALESILLGYVNEETEISRMVEQYHLDLRFDRFAMMLACPEEDGEGPGQTLSLARGLRAAVADCIRLRTSGDAVRYDKKRLALFVPCPDEYEKPEDAEAFLSSLARETDQVCRLNLNVSLRFGISDIHHSAVHIANALEEADCALAHMYFAPQERVYFFGQRRNEETSITLRMLHTELESLQEAASHQDRERLLLALRRFDAAAREASAQGTEIWPWYLRAYFDASSALAQSVDENLAPDEMERITREIRRIRSPDEVAAAVTRLLEEMALRFGETSRTPSNSLIAQVVSYTDEHFVENLTLDFISHTFSIHPAYFCKLFKRTTDHLYRLSDAVPDPESQGASQVHGSSQLSDRGADRLSDTGILLQDFQKEDRSVPEGVPRTVKSGKRSPESPESCILLQISFMFLGNTSCCNALGKR